MVVSFIALFVSLGGAGYAAVSLPRNSVGNAQLQNGSVGNWKLKSNAVGAKKIINGSVGAKQVNSSQLQLRVSSSCSSGAIAAVGLSGSVTCTPTLGNEYGSNTAATTLGTSATQVATQSLAAGSSYLVMAYPHAVITAGSAGARRGRLHAVGPGGVGDAAAGQPDDHDQDACRRCHVDREPGGRDDPAGAARRLVDERPAGDRELHRHVGQSEHAGADGQGRHHDQRDPDRQQQLTSSRPKGNRPASRVGRARPAAGFARPSSVWRGQPAVVVGTADVGGNAMRLPRPSAPLAVSFLALFVALGGVSWAAIHLPPHSVGNAQLQNFSVGNAKLRPFSVGTGKIIPGAVGAGQVNSSQVQLRVAGPCTDGAMQSIAQSGDVTCVPVLPNEYGSNTAATTLGAGPTQVASQSLAPGSSYLVLAYPHAVISGTAGQHVEVDCTLSVPSGSGTPPPANPTTTTKSLAVDLGPSAQAATIPLVLPVASSTSIQPATVDCSDTAANPSTAPTVMVDTTISALQTASNS